MKPSIQIISGKYKFFRIFLQASHGVRPTSHFLRGAVFDILAHRFLPNALDYGPQGHFKGKRVLDLCAGTGGYGFEALSRGAEWVSFVDASHGALDHIKKIAAQLPSIPGDAPASHSISVHRVVLPQLPLLSPCDIVFLDPPYTCDGNFIPSILQALIRTSVVHKDTIVVVEYSVSNPPTSYSGFNVLLSRDMRRSSVVFLSIAKNFSQEKEVE